MNKPAKQEVMPTQSRALNPFEGERKSVVQTAGAGAEVQRAVAEVQAAIMLAKQFPRSKVEAADRILTDCTRASLAEAATYSYKRGGLEVTGASIRLAEVLAANWGNFNYGWKEVSRINGVSEIVAYAWDYESNVRSTREFSVKHWRDTKSGGYAIKEERDIYELCANMAARRMRACILNIIPGDIVESALKQCELTLTTNEVVSAEKIKALITAFEAFGVSKAQIEKRIGRKLDAESLKGNGAVMLSLRKVYNGIKEGMGKPEEFFEPDTSDTFAPAQPAQEQGDAVPPSDWDSFADEIISNLQGAGDVATLDALLVEMEPEVTKLQESGDRAAIKKYAAAFSLRRKQLSEGKLI